MYPVIGFVLSLPIWMSLTSVQAYDMTVNTDKDITMWKFNGSYIYSKSMSTVAALLPSPLLRASEAEGIQKVGLWLARYSDPEADNFLNMKYLLKHQLFSQAWIHFIASPTVPLIVKTNDNLEVGRFWSDGRHWCDAVVSINLRNTISIDVFTSNPGEFALIDKISMGIMSNITQLRGKKLNSCLTSPTTAEVTTDEDMMAPDMIPKPPMSTGNQTALPPDFTPKPPSTQHYRITTSPPPPDMVWKQMMNGSMSALPPNFDTRTITNNGTDFVTTDTNGSSEVKCGCSCSCTRVKGTKIPTSGTTTSNTG